MLKDRGIRRTGKEGADNPALTQAPNLCGPDGHSLKARFELQRLNTRSDAASGVPQPAYDWEARDKLYGQMAKIEKRKNRGGATFSPGDCC